MADEVLGRVVPVAGGRVQGSRQGDHEAFRSVPYAAPPVGARRMAPPDPPEAWDGVRPALSFGATAQRERPHDTPDLIPAQSIAGDDILTVNVVTPVADPRLRLPVLVWIHGGAYESGSPASPWFDGAPFARNGVVTVTVGYRLGFHGFGVIPDEPANRGVRDWIAALEWVQQNITAFGGDPARVTVAGQSAGAGAVLTLLGCPRAEGLFRAAWASSPALPVRDRPAAEQATRRLAQRLGALPTRQGLASLTDDQLRAAASVMRGRGRLPSIARMVTELPLFSPVVDGDLLPTSTLESLQRGHGSNIPLVIGANDDEVPLAVRMAPTWLNRVPVGLALRVAGVQSRNARNAYAIALQEQGLVTAPAVIDRSISDRVFRKVVTDVAFARCDAVASTHAYRLSWPSPVHGGAIHCLDVPFLWNVLDAPHVAALAGPAPPHELVDQLHGTLVRLAHGDDLNWPRWTPDVRQVTRIDTPTVTVSGGYDSLEALGTSRDPTPATT